MRKFKNYLFYVAFLITFTSVSSQAQQLITYTYIPGRMPSDQYTCRVRYQDSDNWLNTFVLQTKSKSGATDTAYWRDQIGMKGWTMSWINFEFDSTRTVEVEIARVSGKSIFKAFVRPVSWATVSIANGKAYVKVKKYCNFNVDIDGQMEDHYTGMGYSGPPVHTISIFANPIITDKPDTTAAGVRTVKPGEPLTVNDTNWSVLYFLSGVHTIPAPFYIHANQTIYIPGDAVVNGSIHTTDDWFATKNIRIYGYGTLSGETFPWTSNPKTVNLTKPIIGVANNAKFEGITIVDPPNHSILFSCSDKTRPNLFKNLKILGWRANGDGINAFEDATVEDCFIRTQDDACYYENRVTFKRCVFWEDMNGASVRIATSNIDPGTSGYIDNVVIYRRAMWHYWGGAPINFYGVNPGSNIQNVVVRNVTVEDPYPTFAPFYGDFSPDGDPTKTTIMKNILLENVVQNAPAQKSWMDANYGALKITFKGLNANNMFQDITFKNCKYEGKYLTFLDPAIFNVNQFVKDFKFIVDTFPAYSTRTDDTCKLTTYIGKWTNGMSNPTFFHSTYHSSDKENASFQFPFEGTGIQWYGQKNIDSGIADVYIDDVFVDTVDCYASAQSVGLLFAKSGLTSGSHTIKVIVKGTKNRLSGGTTIIHDYFSVITDPETSVPKPKEDPKSAVSVFPNPFEKETLVYTNGDLKGNCEFKIVDLTGKIVQFGKQTITNEGFAVGKQLKPGIYILQITTQQKVFSSKIVKK